MREGGSALLYFLVGVLTGVTVAVAGIALALAHMMSS